MNLLQKLRETMFSVFPIMAIVLLLSFTVAPLDANILIRFVAGGILVIVGLTFFLLGVDIGILPVGERIGAALTAKKNLALLLSVSFLIGVIVTIAEPDVQVLADQIKSISESVNKWVLVLGIAAGVGLFVTIGLCRTVLSLNLRAVLIISYAVLFALAIFCPAELQGAAFDAGGATTGPMTVPFIMALGMGVAQVRSSGAGGKQGDSSFGLTGIASIGPVAAVCVYGMILNSLGKFSASAQKEISSADDFGGGLSVFIECIPDVLKEVSLSLLPLVVMFVIFQFALLKLPPVQIRRTFQGLFYCFFGLALFLTGADGGFMDAGKLLGKILGAKSLGGTGWIFLIIAVSLLFGAITVFAEPAVWVLTEQVESVSGGTNQRKIMLYTLSFGVASAVALSMIRIIFGFSLWYILIPGYALALLLTFFCPPLFMGIAFDSGGVASGPMTSTFILSFTLGASSSFSSSAGAFGVIALVAMTPLIAIQILGIMYKIKTRKSGGGK
jgi:hypothetical protein